MAVNDNEGFTGPLHSGEQPGEEVLTVHVELQ